MEGEKSGWVGGMNVTEWVGGWVGVWWDGCHRVDGLGGGSQGGLFVGSLDTKYDAQR